MTKKLTEADILFNALAFSPVSNKRDLQVGDRVRVLYKGHESIKLPIPYVIQDADIVDNGFGGPKFIDRNKMCKWISKPVEEILDGVIVQDYTNLAIKLDETASIAGRDRTYKSGELKNFKKGWNGKPGVGASWGGTGNGKSFLTLGCKIIGFQR